MKYKIVSSGSFPDAPIKIELTLESLEEAAELWSCMNFQNKDMRLSEVYAIGYSYQNRFHALWDELDDILTASGNDLLDPIC